MEIDGRSNRALRSHPTVGRHCTFAALPRHRPSDFPFLAPSFPWRRRSPLRFRCSLLKAGTSAGWRRSFGLAEQRGHCSARGDNTLATEISGTETMAPTAGQSAPIGAQAQLVMALAAVFHSDQAALQRVSVKVDDVADEACAPERQTLLAALKRRSRRRCDSSLRDAPQRFACVTAPCAISASARPSAAIASARSGDTTICFSA